MFLFFCRTLKFALQGFFRNFWLSLVTVIILVLTLFSITLVAGVNVIAERAIESVQEKVDVSVYFKSDVSEEEVLNVRYRVEELSQVETVSYVSEEEALATFKERHADDPIILDSIELLDDNPLGATLIIKASSIDDYPLILAVLDSAAYADLIQDRNYDDNQEVISRLSTLSTRIERIGIIISGIFVVIAVLIIFNTIRINIYTHREEIGIMKLVGATNWFVRAPFLVESIMYAFFAVAISLAILYPLLGVIAPQVDNFFQGYNFDLINYFDSNFWQIVGWQLGFAILLSFLSSSIAIGKYLRV